ncbi:hypothetical protein [uncultured Maribacter sp.]|uniref:hypothetical protein n=1 Tax=uncultured Maribacter sp. TaxID=431308 RepID=UPI002603726F|nr:hypothetical protein [uncultured Maribacter sp.]
MIKSVTTILFLLLAVTTTTAQTKDVLLGKWEAAYEEKGEKFYVTYEFKKEKDKLKCRAIFIKNNKGEKGKYESLTMENIVLMRGKGKATYIYNEDGEKYMFNAKLNLKNKNTLSIKYTYWGFSETEVWKRIM